MLLLHLLKKPSNPAKLRGRINTTGFPLVPKLRPTIATLVPLQINRNNSTMSQDDHILLIPGPICVSEAVREAQSIQSLSHTSPAFISIFQSALKDLRKLFKSTNEKDQGVVVAGSGTLGWDITASNLVYPGDNVLVLSTGFFSDSFADCLRVYGANVDVITAPVGDSVAISEVEKALASKKYSVITVTHVDTSTAVVSDIEAVAATAKKISPETLIVVDGVCSVGVENIEFTKWGLDYVLSASQKAIGVPSGLSVGFLSERAIKRALERPVQSSFFASLQRWLPNLINFEAGKPSYFATPAIQTVNALRVSLKEILEGGLDARFQKNKEVSQKFKKDLADLGISIVPVKPEVAASGLTAAYFPEGIDGAKFIASVYQKGVIVAGGIHKDLVGKYFRVGHMGVSALDPKLGHIDAAVRAIKEALEEQGFKK
ncbi:CYFA0S09e02608g1_1 [Cyberlindnera fabianii]|uniref:alanine--glyoxylate transaminase n=2 Tax=Cyberlindnera fabianii TaxID=36022 RepID=A0A061AXL1_CYBFA|nr:CYFA0S09e02608g1_1 [Cyberlindnera fabianii]